MMGVAVNCVSDGFMCRGEVGLGWWRALMWMTRSVKSIMVEFKLITGEDEGRMARRLRRDCGEGGQKPSWFGCSQKGRGRLGFGNFGEFRAG